MRPHILISHSFLSYTLVFLRFSQSPTDLWRQLRISFLKGFRKAQSVSRRILLFSGDFVRFLLCVLLWLSFRMELWYTWHKPSMSTALWRITFCLSPYRFDPDECPWRLWFDQTTDPHWQHMCILCPNIWDCVASLRKNASRSFLNGVFDME